MKFVFAVGPLLSMNSLARACDPKGTNMIWCNYYFCFHLPNWKLVNFRFRRRDENRLHITILHGTWFKCTCASFRNPNAIVPTEPMLFGKYSQREWVSVTARENGRLFTNTHAANGEWTADFELCSCIGFGGSGAMNPVDTKIRKMNKDVFFPRLSRDDDTNNFQQITF